MEAQVLFHVKGEALFGVLHLPERNPAPAVALCHGFTGHKAEAHRLFVHAARAFAQAGVVALRFDFRGSGDSAGEFRDMTISREIEDASAALDFLQERAEVDPGRLGVLGLSMGGCVAACLAGQDPRVRALALWAPAAHPERIAEHIAPGFGPGPVMDMDGWDLGRAFLEDAAALRPLEAAGRYVGPSIVVHGSEDAAVPPSDASDYRVALGGTCQLHFISGADHVFSSLPWKAQAIQLTRDFFARALMDG